MESIRDKVLPAMRIMALALLGWTPFYKSLSFTKWGPPYTQIFFE